MEGKCWTLVSDLSCVSVMGRVEDVMKMYRTEERYSCSFYMFDHMLSFPFECISKDTLLHLDSLQGKIYSA